MNKYEKAFDYMLGRIEHLASIVSSYHYVKEFDDIKELVERTIPKKTIDSTVNGYLFKQPLCGNCDYHIKQKYPHCPDCGQKLLWEDE